jgi:arginyl-tRNA synthetase
MVFKAAAKADLLRQPHGDSEVVLQHVPFGLVLGEDGKKIKSRAGDSVKLRELLEEAVQLAGAHERQRVPGAASAEVQRSTGGDWETRARVLGLGAVKYADLSMHRESNYKFSFAKMLALSGNTAPYMLYAYVRIRGIQRKAAAASAKEPSVAAVHDSPFVLTAAEETALAKHLVRFHEVVAGVGQDLLPNKVIRI